MAENADRCAVLTKNIFQVFAKFDDLFADLRVIIFNKDKIKTFINQINVVYYPQVCISDLSFPIHLVGNTGQAEEISINTPSPYICSNSDQILHDRKKKQA